MPPEGARARLARQALTDFAKGGRHGGFFGAVRDVRAVRSGGFAPDDAEVYYPLVPGARSEKMPRNTSVILGDHFAGFISEQVRTGRYGSASDVVRAGLRLLEDHEARVQALRDAIQDGERSGPPVPFDFDAFLQRKRAERPE